MSLRLHKEHGLNPGITQCFFCGEDDLIILFGAEMKEKAPMKVGVVDKKPCPKCKEYMKQGIIIISTRDGESGDNPYRTGGWWVVKEEAVRRWIHSPELLESVCKLRICFFPDEVCDKIGLVKESK